MEIGISPMNQKTFHLPVCDCSVCCMLDDGFFHPHQLTGDPHVHLAYELHCCEEGDYRIILSQTGKVFPVSPGCALLMPPGLYHSADAPVGASGGEKYRLATDVRKYTLRFQLERRDADMPPLYAPLRQILGQEPLTVALPDGTDCFRRISAELHGGGMYADQVAELALQSLFLQFFRALLQRYAPASHAQTQKPEQEADPVRYERIIRYLDDNYAKPITEQDLAREMHLSVRQISRIFSKQFGSTFRQVLGQIRLHQARKLLARTELPIEQIALKVGYGSPSAFYAAFKAANGTSPHQYRLHARKSEENLLI